MLHKINVQQLLGISYSKYHNLCSDSFAKFVWLPLHAYKPPLQDDTKL